MSTLSPKPNLDLLRAIAVSYVVLDHTLLEQGILRVGPWIVEWIGDVGVYIFFVHTCLVLMWSLERKPHTLDFYIRRVFRIYPLAIVAITCTLVFRAPVMSASQSYVHPSLKQILACYLLVQNLIGGYNVIGVLWSLPLEVQMYLFLPALYFFVRKNFSLWPILLIWTFAVLFARHSFSPYANDFGTVIPDFLPGILAYITFRRRTPTLPAWLLPIFISLLTLAYMVKPTVFRAWPFCLVLGLGIASFRQIRTPWLVRASHGMAKYSYGIYLSHPFALLLGFHFLPGRPLALQLFVEFVCIGVFSFGAYHLIEAPFIKLGSRLAARAEARYEQKELETVFPAHPA